MDKEAKFGVKSFLVVGLFVVVIFVSLVIAAWPTVLVTPGSVTWFNSTEDTLRYYNITINLTQGGNVDNNITQINITLPANFTFLSGDNRTTLANPCVFTNTSSSSTIGNILTWSNSTYMLANGTTNMTFNFNATATTAGWFNITVSVINSSAVRGTSYANLSVYVNDTTAPTGISTISGLTSGGNYSGNVTVVIAVTDDTLVNNKAILNLTNSTGTFDVNLSGSKVGTERYSFVINTSVWSDGYRNISLWVNDSSNNKNNTYTYRNVLFDNTAPSVTLTRSSSSTKTSLVASIAVNDGLSNISGQCVQNYHGEYGSVSGSGAGTQTFTGTNMVCGTSYTIQISCTDYAGNVGTQSITASTDACGGGDSPAGGGGGTTTTWTNTFVEDVKELSAQGEVTKSLGSSSRVRLKVGGATHYVGVKSVTSSSATLEISSTPQTATLNVGDEKKFDVESDGYYDLIVKLNSIVSNKADITIKAISEKVAVEEKQSGEETTGAAAMTSPAAEKGALTGWIIVLIVIAALVVVGIVFGKKKGYF